MTIGSFWNKSNPLKPWGLMDRNGHIDIVFDWADMLADTDTAYQTHTIVCAEPLECEFSQYVGGGLISARVRITEGQSAVLGAKYGATCHIKTTDGQEDDQTLYLKMIER